MTLSDLCKEAKIDEKEAVDLIYSQKDPVEIRGIIMQKYGIPLRAVDILELLETTPIRTIKIA